MILQADCESSPLFMFVEIYFTYKNINVHILTAEILNAIILIG